MAGVKAFQRAYAETDTLNTATFSSFEARRARYEIFWAFVESTAYSSAHDWSAALKKEYGLYEYTRNIYNPAFRIATFWATHLMGGRLDPAAGDGKAVPSALPILLPANSTNGDRLRAALSTVWQDSNWQTNKDIYTLHGNIMGDVGLRVIDDTARGKAYLNVLHPGTIKSADLDAFGNVKGYVLEELRQDPRVAAKDDPLGLVRTSDQLITYNEVVTRDGVNVVYQTYLNDKLYAWPEHVARIGNAVAEWEEPYGFVPLVLVKHINIGLDWGWSEMQPTLPKIREADDMASKLNDQVRKTVDAKWAFLGAKKSDVTPAVKGRARSAQNPEPGRDEEGAYYLPPGADVKPMIAPLDIAATSAHILTMLDSIEDEHPELRKEVYGLTAGGGVVSGEAIRNARQPVEEKAEWLRPHYDNGEMRAAQMAIAIGGWRKYKGYEGFNLDSFQRGLLNHSIGARPVFGSNQYDALELKSKTYTVLKLAQDAGIPRSVAEAEVGYTEEEIAANQAARIEQATPGLGAIKGSVDEHLAMLQAAITDGAPQLPPAGGFSAVASGAASDTAAVKQVALNGAQVSSALDIIVKVKSGELDRQAGLNALQIMFGMDAAQAASLLVGK